MGQALVKRCSSEEAIAAEPDAWRAHTPIQKKLSYAAVSTLKVGFSLSSLALAYQSYRNGDSELARRFLLSAGAAYMMHTGIEAYQMQRILQAANDAATIHHRMSVKTFPSASKKVSYAAAYLRELVSPLYTYREAAISVVNSGTKLISLTRGGPR